MSAAVPPSSTSRPGDDDLFASLSAQGIQLHTVFNLADLPADVSDTLALDAAARDRYTQLILLGHLGRAFWDALRERGLHGSDPVDAFAGECAARWMATALPGHAWRQVFPGPQAVGLQRLGQLAGWHQASPFWVGVDAEWGSWFAYRAVLLTDTQLPVTPQRQVGSACGACAARTCVSACPAGALASEQTGPWRLKACLDFRKRPDSPCLDRCLARNACPVGQPYRYSEEQTAYHYLHSMRAIRAYD